ncbi:hypothetical protein CRG98_035142 [Punica granatum]|uniref:Uncharacterized protein n=1 Tax=Punica granatum TaxID=22663 RepID=A0A2I0IKE3_PUNGR|nr:hypothetical protein CRG98_035142 [Punica granatum]
MDLVAVSYLVCWWRGHLWATVDAMPPPPHHIPTYHLAAMPVAAPTSSGGVDLQVMGWHDPTAPDHSRSSSTQRCTALERCDQFAAAVAIIIFCFFISLIFVVCYFNPRTTYGTFRFKDFAVSNFSISDMRKAALVESIRRKLQDTGTLEFRPRYPLQGRNLLSALPWP